MEHTNTRLEIENTKSNVRIQKKITQSITKPVSEDDWTITQSIELKNETYKYKTWNWKYEIKYMVTKNITQSILQNLPEKTTRLSEHINTKGTHKIQTFDLFI